MTSNPKKPYAGYCLRHANLFDQILPSFTDKDGVCYVLCKHCLKETETGPYRSRAPRNGEDHAQW